MRIRLGTLALALAVAVIGTGSAGAKAQRADCGYEQLGSTYVYSIKAKRTGCRTARKVAEGFTKCRKRNGGADGRCGRRVKRFRCHERRHDATPQQYSAHVGCKRGAKRVRFDYTQNT